MNSVNLIGNITKDVDVRKTQSNLSVCSFSIAVRRDYKNEKGEYDSDFINCIAWRQSADFMGQYIHKGDKIAVNGVLQTRSYDTQDGRKVFVTEVVCNKVELVHTTNKPQDAPKTVEQPTVNPAPPVNNNELVIEPDDLPFY